MLLIPVLLLVACSNKNVSERPSSSSNLSSNIETSEPALVDDCTRTYSLSLDEIPQHFSYNATWNTNNHYDYSYNSNFVYETIFKVELNQYREGFVTYSGTIKINVAYSWTYIQYNQSVQQTGSYTFVCVLHDYEQQYQILQTFTYSDGNKEPYDAIPYGQYLFITGITISECSVNATYYNYGVSGDESLTYTSYKITTANFKTYFNATMYSSPAISPINSSPLFDYRVKVFLGTEEYFLRRDGYLTSLGAPENRTITKVEGYIDVYPERTI